jgi:asparagine synthase (glutamine-hydrolysing)
MCGITGFFDDGPTTAATRQAVVTAMATALRHRGPDDGGVWVDAEVGIALGHRRLAIIDLSPAGHQPMSTADGRYVIVYNGEIYNFAELAERLRQAGVTLRSRSDTEVLIEGFVRWGIEKTLAQCEGMFALAVWDRQQRTLTLARDRLGIKPLYWSRQGRLFLFASELKALHQHPDWQPVIDRDAVAAFMRFGYVPAPFSIYRDVYKLEPGTILTVAAAGEPRIERYWDLRRIAATRVLNTGSEAEMLDTLDGVLRRAVGNEMVSDVPLGAFLSGGVDSSLVAALMQAQSTQPIRTFTIGFEQDGYDEAQHAKRVAVHLGTTHTELYVEQRAARDIIPRLPVWYDEPFADSSQIPTHIVSRLAREHVTVALSGDGGDELFAGYTRHRWAERLGRAFAMLPPPLRQGIGSFLEAVPEAIVRGAVGLAPARLRPVMPEHKLLKLAGLLRANDASDLYRRIVSLWPEPDDLVPDAAERRGLVWEPSVANDVPRLPERMMLLDTLTYLPDDLLTKVDRASMAVSLEVRVPLLNHRVAEFAWGMPLDMKLRGGTTKWALRQILHRYVPRELIERPKQGFSVPLAAWLRGPLRDWADDLMAPASLARDGWLRAEPVAERWREHRAGRKDWSQSLWAVLMFQSWLTDQQAARRDVAPHVTVA